tara:strand:- start:1495 stop:2253 length:759 start_codon:yes stop_codon:yes gene_type:complete
MIDVKNLSKQFKVPTGKKGLFGKKKENFLAVNSLEFSVSKGQVLSILGPNGCGKTTTLRMIAGMLEPSRGTAVIDGLDIRKHKHEIKSKIGYMTNNTSLYDRLSVIETIKFFADLNLIPEDIYKPRAEKLFKQLDMEDYLLKRVADLSTGMKQKTSIVRTLIHDPDVVILDEPTTGVDVTGQSVIIDLIKSIKESGKTLIFSTHQLGEVRDIADKIVCMRSGKKVFDGTTEEFQSVNDDKNFNEIFMELVDE